MDPVWETQPGTQRWCEGANRDRDPESLCQLVNLGMQVWMLNRAFILCLFPSATFFTSVHALVLQSRRARYWHIQLILVLGRSILLHLNMKYKSEIK